MRRAVRVAPVFMLFLCACGVMKLDRPTGSGGDANAVITVSNDPASPPDPSVPADPMRPWTLLGRMQPGDSDRLATQILSWANSEVRVAVAETASLTFEVAVVSDTPAFTVTIDKQAPKLFTQPPIVVNLDATQAHVVRLRKVGEAGYGVAAFAGVSLDANGRFLRAPLPSPRRIEIIGDSISNGYGNLGANVKCSGNSSNEDASLAYGPLAGAALQADVHVVAWSGRGLIRNGDGSTSGLMPEVWKRTVATDPSLTWSPNAWLPQAVVVNLGTNDFNPGVPDAAAFQQGFVNFLADLRKAYGPTPHIFCAVGPMVYGERLTAARADVQAVVDGANRAGDARVHYLEFSQDRVDSDGNGAGCDYHPDAVKHQSMANDELVPALKSTLGW